MLRGSLFGLLLAIAFTPILTAGEVHDLASQPLPDSTKTAIRGTVDLPRTGVWKIRSATDLTSNKPLRQVYLLPSQDNRNIADGRRMRAIKWQRKINAGRATVNYLYWPCLEYARVNDGRGPTDVGQLNSKNYEYAIKRMTQAPRDWLLDDGTKPQGPFSAILPVEFKFSNGRNVLRSERDVLAVELRPYVGDGKHWVQYTDGSVERADIDPELVKKFKLTIKPIVDKRPNEDELGPETITHKLLLVHTDTALAKVTLHDAISGDIKKFTLKTNQVPIDADVLTELKAARKHAWNKYSRSGQTSILDSWSFNKANNTPPRRAGRNLNMFSLLGGRAAIEETLQLQDLVVSKKNSTPTIDINTIPGVKVAAHPFEKMLGGKPGGKLPLANLTPHDRFFLYVAQPATVLPLIDSGGEFLASLGAGFSNNRLDYGLRDKYLDRLGMNRNLLESAVRSGLIKELVITAPDLFFVDGTDLTVVARLDQPKLFARMLSALNIRGLADGKVAEIETKHGTAYWTLRDDLLCVSSHRGELDSVIRLMENDGAGSLGQSTEFKYMLTKLPVTDETRAFAYFSDPFIRRLVGPKVKIAQFRRMRARRRMEHITAQSLKARLEGHDSPTELDSLTRYIPGIPTDDYRINPDGVVDSTTYGRLERLHTLQEVPVERATEEEAQAYREYYENYEQYWRQFFDPIAIRLNDAADASLQLETFILPLIDSSIYNNVRAMVHVHGDQQRLKIPQIQPEPVMQFSLNLNEKAWHRTIEDFSGFFERYSGATSAILDDLGPGAHMAVFDADPVIALGSGDLMGAMGGNVLRMGRNNQMMMVPVLLSVLTRPCTILIETKNPEQTARYLRQSALSAQNRRSEDFAASFYQQGNRDSWVWSMNVVGLIQMRFGVEVSGQFLVIRNIPWSGKDRVTGMKEAPMDSARLTLTPAACNLQLPGLFASASDQERRATIRNLGRLYPLILSGVASAETAEQVHQKLFGFRPTHPHGGTWKWEDNNLASSLYGSSLQQRQPVFDPTKPFGIMQSIQDVNLCMQFEEDGLRSRVTWRMRRTAVAER